MSINVVNRLPFVLSACATFLLPSSAAMMNHFGVDLRPRSEVGFSFFVSLAHLVLNLMPSVITLVMGSIAVISWFAARPRISDEIHEVEPFDPSRQVARIAEILDTDQRAEGILQLNDFLELNPNYPEARILNADILFSEGKIRSALNEYLPFLGTIDASSSTYVRSAVACQKLGDLDMAIRILKQAIDSLPEVALSPVIFFNLACYNALLGDRETAFQFLETAFSNGYRDAAYYLRDSNLEALRDDVRFQKLIQNGLVTNYRCPNCRKFLRSPLEHVGKVVRCSFCKTNMTVPEP